MNSGSVQAVVFDLDDTLYPERAYVFSGFAAVAAAFADRLGDPAGAAARMRRLFNTPDRSHVFDAVLREQGLPVDRQLVERMIHAYRVHVPTISPHPDAARALTRLCGRFKLGLITDGSSISQWAKVDALGLRDRCDEIIVTGDLEPGSAKPHPRAFELMAGRLGIDPARCLYVADNAAKDFVAANALGWTTVHILRSDGIYRDARPAEGGHPQHVIDNMDELDHLLA